MELSTKSTITCNPYMDIIGQTVNWIACVEGQQLLSAAQRAEITQCLERLRAEQVPCVFADAHTDFWEALQTMRTTGEVSSEVVIGIRTMRAAIEAAGWSAEKAASA